MNEDAADVPKTIAKSASLLRGWRIYDVMLLAGPAARSFKEP